MHEAGTPTLLVVFAQGGFRWSVFCNGDFFSVQCSYMNEQIRRVVTGSDAYALATTGPHGVNVVPLSVVELHGEEIHLYDFFMQKTAENIQVKSQVALACWQGFKGVQIKATAAYETGGVVYEAAAAEMKERFPDRTLRAVIRLTPTAIYDVTPGASGEDMLLE